MDVYSPVGTFSCLHQRMKASALCPGSRKRDKDKDKEKKTGMVRQPTEILRETNHQSFIKHISLEMEYRLEGVFEKKVVTIRSPRAAKITLCFRFNCFPPFDCYFHFYSFHFSVPWLKH